MKCKRKIMVGIAFVAVVLCILFQSNTFGRKKSELIIEEVDLKNNCIYATAKNQLYDTDDNYIIYGVSNETVKAEMNGLTPGLDRSPPPRWMGGQGGQSLKVFGRTRSFWGLSSPKIEMGGKALKWLSRLDYPLAKTGETVNGGAESAVHLDR